jgi:hypothetical protein
MYTSLDCVAFFEAPLPKVVNTTATYYAAYICLLYVYQLQMPVVEFYNQRHVPKPHDQADVVQCSYDAVGCTCTATSTDVVCPGEFVFLSYGHVCHKLGFDPRQDIYLEDAYNDTGHPLSVLYPWEEETNLWDCPPWDMALPVKLESEYGNKSDFENDTNPFGWVDHVHPMMLVPMHLNTPLLLGLYQLGLN